MTLKNMSMASILHYLRFKLSPVGRKVDQAWGRTDSPSLVCSMRIFRPGGKTHKDIVLVLADGESLIISQSPGRRPFKTVISREQADRAGRELNSLNLMNLGRSDATEYDGMAISVAARDKDGRNLFFEMSTGNPRAKIGQFLKDLSPSENSSGDQCDESAGPHASKFEFTVLKTECPHCQKTTSFGITKHVDPLLGTTNQIMCSACGYAEYVRSEISKWRALGDMFRKLSEGQVQDDVFNAFADALALPELKELQTAASAWTCECGERNPATFSECWKCGAPSAKRF